MMRRAGESQLVWARSLSGARLRQPFLPFAPICLSSCRCYAVAPSGSSEGGSKPGPGSKGSGSKPGAAGAGDRGGGAGSGSGRHSGSNLGSSNENLLNMLSSTVFKNEKPGQGNRAPKPPSSSSSSSAPPSTVFSRMLDQNQSSQTVERMAQMADPDNALKAELDGKEGLEALATQHAELEAFAQTLPTTESMWEFYETHGRPPNVDLHPEETPENEHKNLLSVANRECLEPTVQQIGWDFRRRTAEQGLDPKEVEKLRKLYPHPNYEGAFQLLDWHKLFSLKPPEPHSPLIKGEEGAMREGAMREEGEEEEEEAEEEEEEIEQKDTEQQKEEAEEKKKFAYVHHMRNFPKHHNQVAPPPTPPGHRYYFYPKIPASRDGETVESFLKKIKCEDFVEKFKSWDELFLSKNLELRKLEIPIKKRKIILKWQERYRQGCDPGDASRLLYYSKP